MNNNNTNNRGNNNNTNRRRGRGNNNRQGGGGSGQQLNRVDSRARGNAPQMLEKYRKLAHDAHLNGDRVLEEYNLQFADHYFRVIADQRVRQDEQRGPRPERWGEGGEEAGESGEFSSGESEYQPYERASYQTRDREERPAREDVAPREDRAPREESAQREERAPREQRPAREDRAPRQERAPREDRPRRDNRNFQAETADAERAELAGPAIEEAVAYEPPANPFVRPAPTRGLRPRRDDRAPRREDRGSAGDAADTGGFDASVLPPAISISRSEEPADDRANEAPVAEAAPRRRGRPPKAKAEQAAE
ncbi:MAG: DUF4167 domain-containing protein [Novosphingobium sp.]